jgi:LacI family transcriptional regulator
MLGRRPRGYSKEIRQQAIDMASQGLSFREIGRRLGVNPQTALNWARAVQGEQNGHIDSAATDAPSAESTLPKKRPTIEDVAERADVSTSTVSNYLNDKGRMADTTRRRIQAAMEELHFTPSALVRAIRRRRTHILGLLVFGLGSLDHHVEVSVTPPLVAGIYDAAEAMNEDILIYTGWPERPDRHSGLDFLNGHIDGLLWVAPRADASALLRLAAAGLPVVALLTRHVPDVTGYVNADNVESIKMLVRHLTSYGHRRIAFLGEVFSSNLRDRSEGYRLALEEAGLPYDPALDSAIFDVPYTDDRYNARLDMLFALPDPPTAIIVPDDGWARQVISDLRASGKRIPEDVCITGFNDIPDAKRIGRGLTTIRQPFREVGQVAVQRLVALIEGAPVEQCRVTLPTQLIVRNTTAPCSRRAL